MKKYVCSSQLRLVGKGWEIRRYLRQILKASKDDGETLQQYLDKTSSWKGVSIKKNLL